MTSKDIQNYVNQRNKYYLSIGLNWKYIDEFWNEILTESKQTLNEEVH